MNYQFFDYKYRINGFVSDLFSTPHIIYIAAVFILSFAAAYALRSTDHARIRQWLKIQSVFTVLLEAAKISWESFYDITTGQGFNWGGLLPIYACSLFIYMLPLAAWGKGKEKACAGAYLTTIGLLFGGIGVIYCNGLNFYPFWTFGAFYSLYFHAAMFFTGVLLLMTGYVQPEWKNVKLAMVPVLLLALAAIPVNYALGSDYMQIYSGEGVPVYEELAAFLAEKGLRPVYTVIMLLTYVPLAALVVEVSRRLKAARSGKESVRSAPFRLQLRH